MNLKSLTLLLFVLIGCQYVYANFKWQARIVDSEQYSCVGSIISPRAILTAARCVTETPLKELIVTVGDNDKPLKIRSVKVHPNYNVISCDNDLAVLKLEKSLELSDNVNMIKMPVNGDAIKLENGYVMGTTIKCGEKESVVNVSMISLSECRNIYAGITKITDNMLCADVKHTEGSKICQLNTGSSLVMDHQLIGVYSWAAISKPPYPLFPAIFANLTMYRNWLDDILEKYS